VEVSLSSKLSQCIQHDGEPKIEISEDWVITKNYEEYDCSTERCLDAGYRVLAHIPQDHCEALIPTYSSECLEVRLIEVFGETGGSMGPKHDVGIYGIIIDPTSGEEYMLPLVNFDNTNVALNYIEFLGR